MPKRVERQINPNAGKGRRYAGGPGDHMGTNNTAPGATVSGNARIRTQGHRLSGANGNSPMDRSSKPGGEKSWAPGPGNAEDPNGSGLSTTFLPAGDKPRRDVTGE